MLLNSAGCRADGGSGDVAMRTGIDNNAGQPANLDCGLALSQLSGLDAGGSFPLSVGSFRFGTGGGSTLANGEPLSPRFGLTVQPDGNMTLVPPPEGVQVDGLHAVTPIGLSPGQVIASAGATFVVNATVQTLAQRMKESSVRAEIAMPSTERGQR